MAISTLDLPCGLETVRKAIVHAQWLGHRGSQGTGPAATLKAIEHLGYVQLDTLSVVARAHHHTLWNRLPQYRLHHVDRLQYEGKIFEHWAHALAILPMKDYRFSLPIMNRVAAGKGHWHARNRRQMDSVLARIRNEGALMAKDFNDKPRSKAMWARAPSKQALEQLFMEGELMIPYRKNFHKVYDLRERVLPSGVNTQEPTIEEFCQHLVRSYLQVNILGQARQIGYLRKGLGTALLSALAVLQEEGLVIRARLGKQEFFLKPESMELMESLLPSCGFRILSPFDNAIIQRQRTRQLFQFDYQIECYKKRENRQFGYFCLPLLYRNQLVGRLDAKADRKSRRLRLLHLYIEKTVDNKEQFYRAFRAELQRFARFNDCDHFVLEQISGCKKASLLMAG
ncbi:MAG: winged helix DNA-binding domain-containing protein [Gammaproteobacteria bacterium]|nr:winged helix DNA-binding domain-containing protein [Gammaproteobacteria bacterium]